MTQRDESNFDRQWRERQDRIDSNLRKAKFFTFLALAAASAAIIVNVLRLTGAIG